MTEEKEFGLTCTYRTHKTPGRTDTPNESAMQIDTRGGATNLPNESCVQFCGWLYNGKQKSVADAQGLLNTMPGPNFNLEEMRGFDL